MEDLREKSGVELLILLNQLQQKPNSQNLKITQKIVQIAEERIILNSRTTLALSTTTDSGDEEKDDDLKPLRRDRSLYFIC